MGFAKAVKNITIYTTATCVFCHAEKEFFNEHGVKFDDIRVDVDEEAAKKMMELSGQLGVPFTVITKADGSQEKILGFDQPRLTASLGL